jgi:hypothetical protein
MESRDKVLKVIDEAVGIFYEGKELFDEAVEVISGVLRESGDRRIEELLVIAVNSLEVLESVLYLLVTSIVKGDVEGGGDSEGIKISFEMKDSEKAEKVNGEEKKDEQRDIEVE